MRLMAPAHQVCYGCSGVGVDRAPRAAIRAEAHQSKPANPALKKRYDDEVGMLKWHLEPGRPFLQMSRQLIAAFFPEFKP